MKNLYTTLLLIVAFNFSFAQNWEWLRTTGGDNQGWQLESTIDKDNNIIYGGPFTSDTMFVGTDTLVNGWGSQPAGFLIKVSSSGALVWSKVFQGPYFVNIGGIDTDGFGNVYVTGSIGGVESSLDLGNNIYLYPNDDTDMFIAKFSPSGLALWGQVAQQNDWGIGGTEGHAIVVDNIGNSYVACSIDQDTAIVGQLLVPNLNFGNSIKGAFVVKFAPNGTAMNAKPLAFEVRDKSSLAMTPSGKIIMVTNFANNNVIAGTNMLNNVNPGTKEGAIVSFNTNLNILWARAFGSESEDEFTDVAVDNLGNIYVTGGFQGLQMTFAGTAIDNTSFIRGVILKLDNQGNPEGFLSTTSPSGNEISYFTSVDIVNHNEIYVTCLYDNDTVELGSTYLPSPSYFNGFVARIDSTGDAIWMHNSVGSDSTIFNILEHDSDGNIYVGGWYKGSSISFGSNNAINTQVGPYDSFLAKLVNSCDLSLFFNDTSATCGTNNGSSTVMVLDANGGAGPYEYQWTSGDSTQNANSLYAGIYQVVVTDLSTGCTTSGVAMISNDGGAAINVVGSGTNHVTCPGGNDGQILINLVGGTAPRTISWSTGDTTLLLTGLTAGPYDVTVEDAAGCMTTQSIVLTQPAPFNLSYTTTDASCGLSDGAGQVTITGGTPTYSFNWSTGGVSTMETGLSVGDYIFTVTDANGCMDSTIVMINEENGPMITIDSTIMASCLDGNGGSVYISVSGEPGPYSYQWSNGGGTNEDLINVAPGNYAVMVTAANNCSSMISGVVQKELPATQPVCLVTVDTTTGYNLVVWEKEVVGYLSHYNIYQEQTQAGVYNMVGSVPYDSLSQFVDSLASPNIRSYRYKISAVDTCGVESELSWEHKTIHLVKSQFGGDNYLSWDNYEGFTYPSFIIWRYSDELGWENIYTLPSSINSFTDIAPTGTNIDYMIEAIPDTPCTSTKSQDHNTTRSNRHTIIANNANSIVEHIDFLISLYPNPTQDIFQLNLFGGEGNNWSYEVYDVSGKSLIHKRNLTEKNYLIDLSNTESGIYLVRVQLGNKMVFKKVVKQ